MKTKNIGIFNKIISRLSTTNSALCQVSFVAGGTVVAQILGVLVLPIVSRIYSPADFGVMAVYSSVIAILSELSGFRYYLAIPLPKNKKYAEALVFLSLIIQIVFVCIISLVLIFIGDHIFRRLSLEALVPYKYFIPLGLIFIGMYNILIQWSVREGDFNVIGITKISQSVVGAAVKIGIGFLGFKPVGLLLGTIISQAGGITTLLSSAIKKNGFPLFIKNNVYRVALKYRKMPLFSTWYGLINSIGAGLPQLFLSSLYSLQEAGLFSIASSLLSIPINFVGEAMGQVFIQRASIVHIPLKINTLTVSD